MKKKLLALLLVGLMVLSLVACAQDTTTDTTEDTSSSDTTADTTTDDAATTDDTAADDATDDAATETTGGLVGVAMPTKDLQRWNQDGTNMQAQLEAAGYTVDLQYAANDIQTQVSQIQNMIANGCEVLVIASIDGSSLGTVMAEAKEAPSSPMTV